MKKLADIPINDLEILKKIAALAPKEDETKDTPGKARGKKKASRASSQSDLGPLDVEKYLSHYSIPFSKKKAAHKTIYRLKTCLFDPSHKKNEASIVQDDTGLLTYQCFHNSCKNSTWQAARKIISGEETLAPFCEGYDPSWQPSKKKSLIHPEKPYLSVNEKGRVGFNPQLMAGFLDKKLAPFVYDLKEKDFFRYHQAGVWVMMPEIAIKQITQKELGIHAKPRWIQDALDLLKSQAYRPEDQIEYDPMWLNLENGMLNLETMELVPHSPVFNSRAQLSVRYDEKAKCTLWMETLAEIFEDDMLKPDVVQEFFGYCLYPKIIFPAALFQVGQGSNGKYVVERVLCEMLGRKNVSHISLNRMQKDFGPVEIKDKLLNSCGETETGRLDVTNFKKIATGDEIQAEVKYKGDVKFIPIAKHMVSMNAFPGVKEKTDAFFRRIIVLEYKQKFEGENRDVRRGDKLVKELNGIFAWSLQGLKRVLKNDEILVPESVIQAKKRFRAKVNPVLMFVDEICVSFSGSRVLPNELYRAYQEWCEDGKITPLGKNNFYEQIFLNYPEVVKKRDGTQDKFFGIGLADD